MLNCGTVPHGEVRGDRGCREEGCPSGFRQEQVEAEGLETVSLNSPSPITCPLSHARGVPGEPAGGPGPRWGAAPETGRLRPCLSQRPAWLGTLALSRFELALELTATPPPSGPLPS